MLRHLAPAPAPAPQPAAPKAAPAVPAATVVPGELVPLTRMRSIIAQRMVDSKQTSPHVHTCFKVDFTKIVRLAGKRKVEVRTAQRRQAHLYAVHHPRGSEYAEEDADRQIARESGGSGRRRPGNPLSPERKYRDRGRARLGAYRTGDQAGRGEELPGDRARHRRPRRTRPRQEAEDRKKWVGAPSPLRISGIFGEQFGTPIINQPESAILGESADSSKSRRSITDESGSDSIAVRSIIRLTLGFDHRIVDGATPAGSCRKSRSIWRTGTKTSVKVRFSMQ